MPRAELIPAEGNAHDIHRKGIGLFCALTSSSIRGIFAFAIHFYRARVFMPYRDSTAASGVGARESGSFTVRLDGEYATNPVSLLHRAQLPWSVISCRRCSSRTHAWPKEGCWDYSRSRSLVLPREAHAGASEDLSIHSERSRCSNGSGEAILQMDRGEQNVVPIVAATC